jgi:endoglucanase
MKELLLKLANASGPPGSETHVRETISKLIEPHADDIKTDVLGNLIAYRKGIGTERKTILLEANMDEPGIMAIHFEENGFVRIVAVGDVTPAALIGQRVKFTNEVIGIVGAETGKAPKDLAFTDLFVDIGVKTREQAEAKLRIGTAGVVDQQAVLLGETGITARSLDNRIGCAVIIDVLSKLPAIQHDVFVIFSVQKEVGSRGIIAAAFQTGGDFALVAGTAKAGDTPKAERSSLRLNAGPAIKVMDKGIVVPPAVKQMIVDAANAAGIAYQLEVAPDSNSDAGRILLTRDGIPAGAVSVPLRYAKTSSQLADIRDVELASQLILQVVQHYS